MFNSICYRAQYLVHLIRPVERHVIQWQVGEFIGDLVECVLVFSHVGLTELVQHVCDQNLVADLETAPQDWDFPAAEVD